MSTPALSPCSQCGAGVRPGSDWCTLCFADLRPVPPPRPPAPAVTAAAAGAPADGVVGSTTTLACPTCGEQMPALADACPTCGASPLAQLSQRSTLSLTLPLVGDLMRFGRTQRMLVAAALSIGVATVVVVAVAIVGAFF